MFRRSKRWLANRLARSQFLFSFMEVRRAVQACRRDIPRRRAEQRLVSLHPTGKSRGNALLSYKPQGFFVPENDPLLKSHINYWRAMQMARTLVGLGYEVDVIDCYNHRFTPEKEYSVVIDLRRNLERLAPELPKGCIKIFHIDTSHLLFHNAAEASRLLALQQRRGVTLLPCRWEQPNLAIEHADCATGLIEGEFPISTFRYANKPIYPLPAPIAHTFDWPSGRVWDACRSQFLFFASGGLVHKGLDLTLEAFAAMPDCHLTVCIPDQHPDRPFVQAYTKELFSTPNIHNIGWVEVGGEKFQQIAAQSSAVILPSASEGCSSSTLECMHAGLIPIVSRQAGVPVGDFGFYLHTCSIQEIRDTVQKVCNMSSGELEARARQAWDYARTNHTREHFAQEYRAVMSKILGGCACATRTERSTPQLSSVGAQALKGALES